MKLVREAAVSGEPILRHMEYEFPHCRYEEINDQYLLGSDILVAPVLEQGMVKRQVVLPDGKWEFCNGEIFDGGRTIEIDAPLEVLPYFVRCR